MITPPAPVKRRLPGPPIRASLAAVAPPITPHELRELIAATLRVLRDSTRTEDLHRVSEIVSRGRYTALVERARAGDPELAALLRDRPVLDERAVDVDRLRRLGADTLGGAYVRHLEGHGLELYTTPTSAEFIADPDVRYLMQRFRQTHDIWHVLVGLGIAGHEEVLLHAFAFGQLRLPNSAMIVVLGGLKHLVLERRWLALRRGLRQAYESGRRAAPLLAVRWEVLWERPLAELRRTLAIRPCDPAVVAG